MKTVSTRLHQFQINSTFIRRKKLKCKSKYSKPMQESRLNLKIQIHSIYSLWKLSSSSLEGLNLCFFQLLPLCQKLCHFLLKTLSLLLIIPLLVDQNSPLPSQLQLQEAVMASFQFNGDSRNVYGKHLSLQNTLLPAETCLFIISRVKQIN